MKLYSILTFLIISYTVDCQTNNKVARDILDSTDKRKVYLLVDKMPECSMDMNALRNYIFQNNFWPEMDKSCWFDKIVYEFVVEPNAEISNVVVQIRGTTFCDDSLRIENYRQLLIDNLRKTLTSLPWTAGELNGKKVPVRFIAAVQVELRFD